MTGLVGVVLAAGEGTRLRPLTLLRPKPLCPVAGVAALDLTVAGTRPVVDAVAVNAWYLADQLEAYVRSRWPGQVHVSVERPDRLGTAGAIGALRDVVGGRAVLVRNADAYLSGDDGPAGSGQAERLLDGWGGRYPRLLVRTEDGPADFGNARFVGLSLLPADVADALPATPGGLFAAVWGPAWAAGRLELVETTATAIDVGTSAGYLSANLHAAAALGTGPAGLVDPEARVSGTVVASVVGAGAVVRGTVRRCVVWPGAVVQADEDLLDVVRAVAADGSPVTLAADGTAPALG